MATKSELVLVTGGTGFLGVYCILHALAAGYRVRTTIRSTKREADLRKMLEVGEATNIDNLSVVVADLSHDEGWKEAVEGCAYVLHVASPFPVSTPKDENDLILPAREGTLRVLRAARDVGVKRVVVTSSFAAIGYGHEKPVELFNEEVFTNPDGPGLSPYIKSKALAERAAWKFIEEEGGALELSVVNPTAIFGPVLGPDFSTSVQVVQRLLNGSMPGCPDLNFGVIDVRDVADLHLRAMVDPKAKGERFLCVSPPTMTILEISLALKEGMGPLAKKAPTRVLPNILLKLVALFDTDLKMIIPELGGIKNMSNEKAKNLLGWNPRSNVEAVLAAGESLVKFGLV